MQGPLQLRSSSRQSPLLLSWSAPAAGKVFAIALEGEVSNSMNEVHRRLDLRPMSACEESAGSAVRTLGSTRTRGDVKVRTHDYDRVSEQPAKGSTGLLPSNSARPAMQSRIAFTVWGEGL